MVIKLELNFKIENQRIRQCDDNFIVQKSNKYLKLNFHFLTDDWIDLSKFIILKDSNRTAYEFSYSDDGIIVPSAVLTGNQFYVTVYGGNSEKRITTNEVGVLIAKTGYTRDITPVEDEPEDVFVQIFEMLDDKPDKSDISAVGYSGDYDDLINKPSGQDVETEIKYAYTQLKNAIRSKGGQ